LSDYHKGLRPYTRGDELVIGLGSNNGIVLMSKVMKLFVRGVRRRMHLPAEPGVHSQPAVDPKLSWQVQVKLLFVADV